MATIRLKINERILYLEHPDFGTLLNAVKSLDGRSWNAETKLWTATFSEKNIQAIKPYMNEQAYNQFVSSFADLQKNLFKKLKEDFPFLYPFQIEGVFQLVKGKSLLADHVGLGKTVQSIAFAENIGAKKVLVVCPAALKRQWKKEIEDMFGGDAFILENLSAVKRANAIKEYSTGYLIINYEQLMAMWKKGGIEMPFFDLVIYDEIHRIKNSRSMTHAAARAVKCTRKIGLSATPFVNSPMELYTICKFLNFGFMEWREFMQRYTIVEYNRFAGRDLIVGYQNLPALHERLKTMMVRREKKDVFKQIPSRVYKDYLIELDRPQKLLVDHYTTRATSSYDADDKENLLANLTLARMACDSSELILQSNSPLALVPKTIAGKKVNVLAEFLEEVKDEKVIIFTQWARMAEILHRELPNSFLVTGNTTNKDAVIDAFKTGNRQLLIATDCLNYGVNLQFCSIIVHFDLPWSPARIEQREGRIDRIGQQNNMLIVRLVVQDSIEERVIELITQKTDLFSKAVEGQVSMRVVAEVLKG